MVNWMECLAAATETAPMKIASAGLTLRYGEAQIRQAFALAAEAGPQAFLTCLHHTEFSACDQYDWPWTRWKQLEGSGYDRAGLFPANLHGSAPSSLAQAIQDRVIAVRTGNPEEANLGALFGPDPRTVAEAAAELPFVYQLELMSYAFYQRRWGLAARLSRYVLVAAETPHDEALAARMRDLAFETLFFSIYRPAMPHFVANPDKLMTQLTNFGTNPRLQRVLTRDSITARVYEANCLAMEAKFPEALALYQQASDMAGFRSPVFSQAQTLISIDHLKAMDPAPLDAWWADHISTDHVFRHETAGEHAVLVACEAQYLDLFGELYTQILALTNPGALVHFHFVNLPGERSAIEARLDRWEARHNIRINYSLEQNKIMADMPDHRGGICVCTRYVHLPEYLEAYKGVTITDIDGWLEAKVAELDDFEGADAKISSWIWRKNPGFWRLPWGNLAGGYISFAATEGGKAFADLVSRYLVTVYKRNAYAGKGLFYADQAGVFLCLQHLVRDIDLNVGFIRGGFAQSEEQRFGARHSGKQMAMQEKIEELKGGTGV